MHLPEAHTFPLLIPEPTLREGPEDQCVSQGHHVRGEVQGPRGALGWELCPGGMASGVGVVRAGGQKGEGSKKVPFRLLWTRGPVLGADGFLQVTCIAKTRKPCQRRLTVAAP